MVGELMGIALLVFGGLVLVCAALVALLATRRKPAESALENLMGGLSSAFQDLGELKSQVGQLLSLAGSIGNAQDAMSRHIVEARMAVQALRAEQEAQRLLERELQASSRRIEAVLLGARSRGEAGENILREAFKQFPSGMIDYNLRVRGKQVEYALVLANKKRLAIDSKWPAGRLLEELNEEPEPSRRAELESELERQLLKKVSEVSQYIDPPLTLPWAIAAVPDAVFSAARGAQAAAFRQNVVIMPYSMAVPYTLALYNLHLQYSRSVDWENMEGCIRRLEAGLDSLERALENSIGRGATMVANAYNDCRRVVGEMRGALATMVSLPGNANEVEEDGA